MSNQSYKIAVIGNHDAILPFQLLGFTLVPLNDASLLKPTIQQLADNQFGIIYLTETLAKENPDAYQFFKESVTPAVILIPTHQGSLGIGKADIQKNVEKAVGQNIL